MKTRVNWVFAIGFALVVVAAAVACGGGAADNSEATTRTAVTSTPDPTPASGATVPGPTSDQTPGSTASATGQTDTGDSKSAGPEPGGTGTPPSPPHPAGATQSAAQVQRVPALPLRATASPQGDYSIEVPAGWTLNETQSGGAVLMTPSGQEQPSINIWPMVLVSDARYATTLLGCQQQGGGPTDCALQALQVQLSDSSHPWAPQDGLRLLLNLQSSASVTFGPPEITPLSSDAVQFSVAVTENGKQFLARGYLQMAYFSNAFLTQPSGQPGTSSFAFVSACEVPAEQIESLKPTCASVLYSFRPAQTWLTNAVQQGLHHYETELQMFLALITLQEQRTQMISEFGSFMQAAQLKAYEDMQASMDYVGQGWAAALGGNTRVWDPDTENIYTPPAGYKTYCLTGAGSYVGYSNDYLSAGQGGCDKILPPVPAP